MRFGGISLFVVLMQVALVVHVIKTGRNMLWIWALALLPGLGSLAYFLVEVLPGVFGSRGAQGLFRSMRRVVDPNRGLRQASVTAAVTDTVAAKVRLAAEQSRRGNHAVAIETYRSGLRGLYEHDPTLLLGLSEAQHALGDIGAARTSLEALFQHNPEFKSPSGHLLYARVLETAGELARAEIEYRAVAAYFPGAEAKLRLALLLKQVGKQPEARELLQDLLSSAAIAPGHVRRSQGQWISLARRALSD